MATRWSPDTCNCVIEYDMDGEELINIVGIKTCKKHADLTGNELAKRVLERNRAKNYVHAELIAQGAEPSTLSVRYDPEDDEQLLVTDHGLADFEQRDAKKRLDEKFPNKRIKVI
jgi:hypothetical protein